MLKRTSKSRIPERKVLKTLGVDTSMQISDLFIDGQIEMLMNNDSEDNNHLNNVPISYIRSPKYNFKFLITEISKKHPNIAYGLVSKNDSLKIEHVNLDELIQNTKGDLRPDFRFTAEYPLAVYAFVADYVGTLVIENTSKGFAKEFSKFSQLETANSSLNLGAFQPKIGHMF